MANAKSYREMRNANVDENRRMLQELGVRMPSISERVMLSKPKLPPKRPKQRIPNKIPERDREEDDDGDGEKNPEEYGRSGNRSFRIRLKPKNYQEEEDVLWDAPKPRSHEDRPLPSYGSIPGVEVGRQWATRLECNNDLIHRPTVAGIHGGPEGAYSVALSGGYEDDIDFGESFTYTGEGGRNLKGTKDNPKNLRTAPQSKDQTLLRGNLALARSVETQNPVRVVRGYKLDSQYAPDEGYRYDGLYQVKKYWAARGKSGFKVWKFAFVRCDPEPAPWIQVSPGTMGSPTSPTTPASIPQTGVEACEAPSLEADDSDDNIMQLEEAKKGAKQPGEREERSSRKKVSFNSEDSVRYFEPERNEEEESPRMATRRSSKLKEQAEKKESEEEEIEPVQHRERSKRTVKPTAKVLENIVLESDKKVPKDFSKLSISPLVVVTDLSVQSPFLADSLKKLSGKEDEERTPKKSYNKKMSEPPKLEKFLTLTTDFNGNPSPERRTSLSPEEESRKMPILTKSADGNVKKSPQCSPANKSRKRSVSPDYPPVDEKWNKSLKSFPEDIPIKRSISPEYPLINEMPKSSSQEKPMKRSISPEYPLINEMPKKSPKSSPQEKPMKRSISPKYLPTEMKKGEKISNRLLRFSSEDSSKKSPRLCNSLSKDNSRKRSLSPEYYPEDIEKIPKSPSEGNVQKKTKSPTRNFPKKSPKIFQISPKEWKGKKFSPKTGKCHENSPEHPKSSKKSLSPSPPLPPSSNSSESSSDKSAKIRKKVKSPEPISTGMLKTSDSPKKLVKRTEKSSSKVTKSPEELPCPHESTKAKAKKTVTEESERPLKRSRSSSDEDSPDNNVPLKKKPRLSSQSSTYGTKKGKKAAEEDKEEISLNEDFGDAPISPESIAEEVPLKRKRGQPTKISLPEEPEMKKLEKEVPEPEILTPPDTESSNSNTSSPSPNPTPPSSLSSLASSVNGSQPSVTDSKKTCEFLKIDDDEEFPTDEEILSMMQFSLSSCSNEGPKIIIKMVNGKWIEVEEPIHDRDTAIAKKNASNQLTAR